MVEKYIGLDIVDILRSRRFKVRKLVHIDKDEYDGNFDEFLKATEKSMSIIFKKPSSIKINLSGSKKSFRLEYKNEGDDTYEAININEWLYNIYTSRQEILNDSSGKEIYKAFKIIRDDIPSYLINEQKSKDILSRVDLDLIYSNKNIFVKLLKINHNEYMANLDQFDKALVKALDFVIKEDYRKISFKLSKSKKSVWLKIGENKNQKSINVNSIIADIYKNRKAIINSDLKKLDIVLLSSSYKELGDCISDRYTESKNIYEKKSRECVEKYFEDISKGNILSLATSVNELCNYEEEVNRYLNDNPKIKLYTKNLPIKKYERFKIITSKKSNLLKRINAYIKQDGINRYSLNIGGVKLYELQLGYCKEDNMIVKNVKDYVEEHLNIINKFKIIYEKILVIVKHGSIFAFELSTLFERRFKLYSPDLAKFLLELLDYCGPICCRGCSQDEYIRIIVNNDSFELNVLSISLDMNKIQSEDIGDIISDIYNTVEDSIRTSSFYDDLKKHCKKFVMGLFYPLEKTIRSSMIVFNNIKKEDIIGSRISIKNMFGKSMKKSTFDYLNWLYRPDFDIEGACMNVYELMEYLEKEYGNLGPIIYKENNLYVKTIDVDVANIIVGCINSRLIILNKKENKIEINEKFLDEILRFAEIPKENVERIEIDKMNKETLIRCFDNIGIGAYFSKIDGFDMSYELLTRTEFNDKEVLALIEVIDQVDNILLYVFEYTNVFKNMDSKFLKLLELKLRQAKTEKLKIFLNETLYIKLGLEQFRYNSNEDDYMEYFSKRYEALSNMYHHNMMSLLN